MPIDFISAEDMENIAETVLAKAGKPYKWQGRVERTDIDDLIEFDYGLDITWENIDHLAPNEVVLAAIQPKHKRIYMNETQIDFFEDKKGAMNFSKAHELGHWVLHVTEQKDFEKLTFGEDEVYYCRSTSKKSPHEIQADMFAAAILMPKNVVCGAVNEYKADGDVSLSGLYKIKDAFEVSISALINRIHGLKLLYIKDKQVYYSEKDAAKRTI